MGTKSYLLKEPPANTVPKAPPVQLRQKAVEQFRALAKELKPSALNLPARKNLSGPMTTN